MRVLVVGSGGREHALAWKLSQEAEVLCGPGNAGIAEDVECVALNPKDKLATIELCGSRGIDLVVVGPEDPLVDGLGDALRTAGIPTYGPNAAGAQLEGSKAFSKEIMAAAQVPTAAFGTFQDAGAAKDFAVSRFAAGRGVAVKASGNALGKGVVVCGSLEEAVEAIEQMMMDRVFGDAGQTVVVEDRLKGREFSLLTMVSDGTIFSLPVCQDHKRVFDEDLGPNTGGMGTYSPVPWVTEEIVRETERRVVEPALTELRRRGINFRGTLFSGLMLDGDELNCLEYNVRFGDPEMQSVALRLGAGFLNALHDCALGRSITPPEIKANSVMTVVLASGGYPGSYDKGFPIEISPLPAGVKVFHAATAKRDGVLVTNGGRVLAVSAEAKDFENARALAYEGVGAIRFDGMHHRRDIGAGA